MSTRKMVDVRADPDSGLTCGVLTKYGRTLVAQAKTCLLELSWYNSDNGTGNMAEDLGRLLIDRPKDAGPNHEGRKDDPLA